MRALSGSQARTATVRCRLRKRWCTGYLRTVGRDRLAAMGYDLDELSREVAGIDARRAGLASDVARRAYGYGRLRASGRRLGRRSAPAGAGAATPPAKTGAPT